MPTANTETKDVIEELRLYHELADHLSLALKRAGANVGEWRYDFEGRLYCEVEFCCYTFTLHEASLDD